MSAAVEYHPEAVQEAREAHEWYQPRSPKSAARFLAELDRAVEAISEAPDRYPLFSRGTRVYQLRRFPFLVIYRVQEDHVTIVAVAHGRRKPGYWKARLQDA